MRIASLSPAVTEILFALEQQKKIVCRDCYSDFPESVANIPSLPDHRNIDPEALRSFTPDIVFTSTLAQEKCAGVLKDAGFAVVHEDPRSLADIVQHIRRIGVFLDCQARAEALIGTMQQGFNETKRKAGLFARRPKVYVEECCNPPMVSGNWVPEVVTLAGGTPFPMTAGVPSREVSLEEVRSFDPDVILLSMCGAGLSASKDLLTTRQGWSQLRAVQENHVFLIDDSLLGRPGPRLTEGARRIFGWCFQAMH